MKIDAMIGGAAACVLLAAAAAGAEERRAVGAHEHGHGTLRIAVDGGALAMEFVSPGADIVGFEHAAETDADRARVEQALALLGDPAQIVVLPDAAQCRVVEASAETVGEHDDDGHEGEEHHDDEDHHGDEDHHDDEENHGGARHDAEHSEFVTTYLFDCADIAALDRISLAYFDRFPNAEELDVQILSADGAAALEVDAGHPVVELPAAR